MAKDDQQDAFERALSSTLVRVVDFLKFSEAKNAALLTFSSAWTLGALTIISNSTASPIWRLSFGVALPFFACAALFAIVSFLPRVRLSAINKDPEQSRSLLYFGDAAQFSPAAFKARIFERYYPPDGHVATQNYLDDLSVQIVVNSQIIMRKLMYFNIGATLILTAFIGLFCVSLWSIAGLIY